MKPPSVVVVGLLFFAAVAAAAPSVPKSGEDRHAPARGIADTVSVLPAVKVEGSRATGEARSTAPTVRLDRAQLVRFLPSTPVDAISSAPGVEMIRTGPWASRVSFRGLSGERVLLLVDGVRLNTGRGHGTQASLVPVDRLDQVEILPGANSAEFGSDAMGGVINLVTHRPLFAAERSLTLSISARGSDPGGEVAQNGRLRFRSRDWGAEVSGGAARLDELVTARGSVPNSGDRESDFGARAGVRLLAGSLDAEYTRHAAYDIGLPAFNSAVGATGTYPLQAREATRLEYQSGAVPSFLGIPVQARLLAVDQRFSNDFDETTVDVKRSALSGNVIQYKIVGSADRIRTRSRGLQPELRFGSNGAVRLSGELRREETSGPRAVNDSRATPAHVVFQSVDSTLESVPHARRDVAAGALAAAAQIGALRIESAARYDWLRSRADTTAVSTTRRYSLTDRRWSLDGGLAYRTEGLESYARVASSFRAPNLEERYFDGFIHGGLRVFGNEDLVPERGMTYETGLRGTADGWGSFQLSAYRSDVDQYITFKYVGMLYQIPRFQYSNVKHARIEGIELTGRARAGATSFSLSATQPRGRDLVSGDRLNDVGSARVNFEIGRPAPRWIPQGMIALRARWSDALEADPAKPVSEEENFARPAFWTFSAELGATLMGTRATLAVRNILDHYYREPLSYVDEPGRTFSFALKRDFQLPLASSRRGSL